MSNYVYFGNGVYNPYVNLAIDEVLLERSGNETIFFRFYSFASPTIILAYRQSLDDLRMEFVAREDIQVARRLSPGGAMYCDQRSFCYSIIGPVTDPQRTYGKHVARALAKLMKSDIHIGKDFSLRTRPDIKSIVVGNGTKSQKKGHIYHGIIAISPWNYDLINRHIVLSETEQHIVPQLPYVDVERPHLIQMLIEELTGERYKPISQNDYSEVLQQAEKLASDKYAKHHWIYNAKSTETSHGPYMETGGGFCFCVTWGQEEKIVDVVRYSQISVGD